MQQLFTHIEVGFGGDPAAFEAHMLPPVTLSELTGSLSWIWVASFFSLYFLYPTWSE